MSSASIRYMQSASNGIVPLIAAAKPSPIPRRFLYLHGRVLADDANALFRSRNFGLLDRVVSTNEAFERVDHLELDVSNALASDVLRQFIDKPFDMTVPRDVAAAFVRLRR